MIKVLNIISDTNIGGAGRHADAAAAAAFRGSL